MKELVREILFVRKCVRCGEIMSREESGEAFCARCLPFWREAMTDSCALCFASAVECTCCPEILVKAGALTLRKLTFYDAENRARPQNKLLFFIKNKKNRRASRFVAKELLPLVSFELSVLGVENAGEEVFITCVPRGRKAVAFFGHDQSAIICRELSELMGIPFLSILKSRRGVREQKKLGVAQRSKNAESMLVTDERFVPSVEGRCALLFDDVVTTGASMSAAVKRLRKLGVDRVLCLSIAMTPKKNRPSEKKNKEKSADEE